MTIIGIDPGLSGAIAVAHPHSTSPSYTHDILVFDMPTLEVGKKRWVNAALLSRLLSEMRNLDPEAVLERVGARPGQGVTSMFNFGMGYGIVQGVLAALQIPTHFVAPQTWRQTMRVPPGKDGARMRVLELRPDLAGDVARKKDQGRADAIMIALYGRQK